MSTELTENDSLEKPISSETEAAVTPDSLETETLVAVETLSREDEILIRYRQAGGTSLRVKNCTLSHFGLRFSAENV